jgi:hypothetical protein
MNVKLLLPLIIIGAILTGCQPVLTDHPIGVPVTEDLSRAFDGTWQTADGEYIFYVKARANGVLSVSGLEWKADRYVVRDTTCYVTKVGEWMYLNVPLPPDSAGKTWYLFAPFLMSEEKRLLTAFLPRNEYFRDAVKAGTIAGKSADDALGYTLLNNPDPGFFAAHVNDIIAASEPLILKRTRSGSWPEAWPLKK